MRDGPCMQSRDFAFAAEGV